MLSNHTSLDHSIPEIQVRILIVKLIIGYNSQFLIYLIPEFIPVIMIGFQSKVTPKHILNIKSIFVVFADFINEHITINNLVFAVFVQVDVLFLVFGVHFDTGLIYLFEGGHIFALVFEEGVEFLFKYMQVYIHLLLHPQAYLLYTLKNTHLLMTITLYIEFHNRILQILEYSTHFSQRF